MSWAAAPGAGIHWSCGQKIGSSDQCHWPHPVQPPPPLHPTPTLPLLLTLPHHQLCVFPPVHSFPLSVPDLPGFICLSSPSPQEEPLCSLSRVSQAYLLSHLLSTLPPSSPQHNQLESALLLVSGSCSQKYHRVNRVRSESLGAGEGRHKSKRQAKQCSKATPAHLPG